MCTPLNITCQCIEYISAYVLSIFVKRIIGNGSPDLIAEQSGANENSKCDLLAEQSGANEYSKCDLIAEQSGANAYSKCDLLPSKVEPIYINVRATLEYRQIDS